MYEVIGAMTELPVNSRFIVIPGCVETGALTLIAFRDSAENENERYIIGRWFPDIAGAGYDLIWQPEQIIKIEKRLSRNVRVIGIIVPTFTQDQQCWN